MPRRIHVIEEWFNQGRPNPAIPISRALEIHTSTAREWIRVGHALDDLPGIGEAFANNDRSVTVHTDADGMIIIRAVLPPSIGKAIAKAVNTIVKQVAATPNDPPADGLSPHTVTDGCETGAVSGQDASAVTHPTDPRWPNSCSS